MERDHQIGGVFLHGRGTAQKSCLDTAADLLKKIKVCLLIHLQ